MGKLYFRLDRINEDASIGIWICLVIYEDPAFVENFFQCAGISQCVLTQGEFRSPLAYEDVVLTIV